MIEIGAPKIRRKKKLAAYTLPIESPYGETELRYAFPARFADMVSETADAGIVAMLIPAMTAGEDIRVKGTISEKLFYNLSGPYQQLLRALLPKLSFVNIHPDRVERTIGRDNLVITGASGGIDSFSVLISHHYARNVPPGYRLTHLLFNEIGSHRHGRDHYLARLRRIEILAEKLGLPLISVRSNLPSFYPRWNFVKTHTPRSTSVALMLSGRASRFLYASGNEFSEVGVDQSKVIARTDLIGLPMTSSEAMDCLSIDPGLNRVQKTLRVAELPDAWSHLDVCFEMNREGEPTNCGGCEKCLRTIATLEIAGFLDRFATQFNLDTYRRNRAAYFAALPTSEKLYAREIVALAAARNVPLC